MAVTLGEITDRNREAVLALRVAPGQDGSSDQREARWRKRPDTRSPSRGTGRSTRAANRSGS